MHLLQGKTNNYEVIIIPCFLTKEVTNLFLDFRQPRDQIIYSIINGHSFDSIETWTVKANSIQQTTRVDGACQLNMKQRRELFVILDACYRQFSETKIRLFFSPQLQGCSSSFRQKGPNLCKWQLPRPKLQEGRWCLKAFETYEGCEKE